MTHLIENFEKLSRLAQIAFSEEEQLACQSDLARMIDMIDTINGVETDGIEPLAHPLSVKQRLRCDEITERVEREVTQKLAPRTENGFYLVPRVLE